MTSKTLEIYTDGGCRPNPGRGVAGFIVVDKQDILHQFTHVVPVATNNLMELLGMIAALKWVKHNASDKVVYIHTDSQYIQRGINEWMETWKRNNWISSNKKPVANKEMWQQIDGLKTKQIIIQWVRAHNGNQFNECVDNLCTQALKDSLYETSLIDPPQPEPEPDQQRANAGELIEDIPF